MARHDEDSLTQISLRGHTRVKRSVHAVQYMPITDGKHGPLQGARELWLPTAWAGLDRQRNNQRPPVDSGSLSGAAGPDGQTRFLSLPSALELAVLELICDMTFVGTRVIHARPCTLENRGESPRLLD
jgi:hypothetical protein